MRRHRRRRPATAPPLREAHWPFEYRKPAPGLSRWLNGIPLLEPRQARPPRSDRRPSPRHPSPGTAIAAWSEGTGRFGGSDDLHRPGCVVAFPRYTDSCRYRKRHPRCARREYGAISPRRLEVPDNAQARQRARGRDDQAGGRGVARWRQWIEPAVGARGNRGRGGSRHHACRSCTGRGRGIAGMSPAPRRASTSSESGPTVGRSSPDGRRRVPRSSSGAAIGRSIGCALISAGNGSRYRRSRWARAFRN